MLKKTGLWGLFLLVFAGCTPAQAPAPAQPKAPPLQIDDASLAASAGARGAVEPTPLLYRAEVRDSLLASAHSASMATKVSPALLDLAWTQAREIDPLYDRIAADIQAGKPVIFSLYYGLWFDYNDQPEKNLNWNTYYGHARMLTRVHRDKHIKKNYRFKDWVLIHEESSEHDPLRIKVYHQEISPNDQWQKAGVEEPFDAYLVLQAYQNREDAGLQMANTLLKGEDRVIDLEEGLQLDAGAAQVTAYFGHNFFYDWDHWGEYESIDARPERPVGFAAVGCKTGRIPGFHDLFRHNVLGLLLSRYLMAAEGYSTLALTDGILRHLDSKALVDLANDTYVYFHQINHPEKKVGRPFIGQMRGLFPLDIYDD